MDGIVDDDGIRRYFGKYPGLVIGNTPAPGVPHRGEVDVEVGGMLEDDPKPPGGRRALRVTAQPCFPPGLFWVPEVGQPVWVEFVAGRVDRAVWCGVWYAKHASPTTVDGAAPTTAHKVVRTAGGHVVQFEDPQGDGKDPGPVTAADAHGNRVTLSRGRIEVQVQPTDTGEATIVVGRTDDQASITITTVDGKAQIALAAGDSTITVDSDGITLSDGANTITLSASTAAGGIAITDAHGHRVELSRPGVKINDRLVVLQDLADLFARHTHLTSMGPAALNPADQAQCLTGEQSGKMLSGPKAG